MIADTNGLWAGLGPTPIPWAVQIPRFFVDRMAQRMPASAYIVMADMVMAVP